MVAGFRLLAVVALSISYLGSAAYGSNCSRQDDYPAIHRAVVSAAKVADGVALASLLNLAWRQGRPYSQAAGLALTNASATYPLETVRALAPIPGFGEPYNSSLVVSIAYGLNDTESYDDLTKAVAEAFKQDNLTSARTIARVLYTTEISHGKDNLIPGVGVAVSDAVITGGPTGAAFAAGVALALHAYTPAGVQRVYQAAKDYARSQHKVTEFKQAVAAAHNLLHLNN